MNKKVLFGLGAVGLAASAGYFGYKLYKKFKAKQEEKSIVKAIIKDKIEVVEETPHEEIIETVTIVKQDISDIEELREVRSESQIENLMESDIEGVSPEEDKPLTTDIKQEDRFVGMKRDDILDIYQEELLKSISSNAYGILSNLWDLNINPGFIYNNIRIEENSKLWDELVERRLRYWTLDQVYPLQPNFVDLFMWAADVYLKHYAMSKEEVVDMLLVDLGFINIQDEIEDSVLELETMYELAERIIRNDDNTNSFFLSEYKFTSFYEEVRAFELEMKRGNI